MAEVQEYINREAADIEARKLGLMDSAKALAEKGYEIPEYVLAGLTQDQKDALALAKAGIGAYKPSQTHPTCLLYTSPSPRDGLLSRMPSSA